MKKGLLILSLLFLTSFVFAQTTTTYTQQQANYPVSWSNSANNFNQGSYQFGQWAHPSSAAETVSWRKFTTTGTTTDITSNLRSLSIGDSVVITLSCTRAYGEIGFSLLSGPSARGSWNDRNNNAAITVKLDGPDNGGIWGVWTVVGSSTLTSSLSGDQGAWSNYTFSLVLTAQDRMNVYINKTGTNSGTAVFYDVALNNTNPITDYSVYLQDDWDNASNQNIYWGLGAVGTQHTVTDSHLMYIGTTNSFTESYALTDGIASNSTVTSVSNSLTKVGATTLTLSATGTYTGATSINAGTLKLGIVGGVGASSAVTDNGTLDINALSPTLASLAGTGTVTSSTSGTPTLTVGNASSTNFSGVIQNGSATTVGLTKAGSGTLTLSGTNSSYTGLTTINAGTLAYNSIANLSSNSSLGAPTTAANGTITMTASGTDFQFVGSTSASSNRNFSMTTAGSGNTYTIDASGTSGATLTLSGTMTVATDAQLILSGSGTGTASGNITINGNSRIYKTGTGTWTVSGTTDSYTKRPTISGGGTLIVSNLSGMGTGANDGSLSIGGTLQYTGSGNLDLTSGASPGVTLTGTSTLDVSGTGTENLPTVTGAYGLTLAGSGTGTASGIISTITSLTKNGNGTWTLSAGNTYTGSTTINNGTIALNNTHALPASSSVILNGGTLSLLNGITDATSGTLSMSSSSTIQLAGASTTGTLTLGDSHSASWTGTLTINGWTGVGGASGTGQHIFIGSGTGTLTAAQLLNVTFTGFPAGAMLLSTGELVPTAAVPTVVLSSISTVAAANIQATTSNNIIYNFQLAVSTAGITVNTVNIPNSGTYTSGDFTNFQLWYDTVNAGPGSGAQSIATIPSPTNTNPQSFSGLTQAIASGKTGYFWITADVTATATAGHYITVTPAISFSNLTFSATTSNSGTAVAGGQQTIVAAPSWSITDFYINANGTQYSKNGTNFQGEAPSTFFNGNSFSSSNAYINDIRVYTTRNAAQSICSATMYYSIYPSASTPSNWTSVNLTTGGTGATSNTTGGPTPQLQALGAVSPNINMLCGLATGTYKMAVYFTFNGNSTSSTCSSGVSTPAYTDNNGGNYYVITYTNTASNGPTATAGTAINTCSSTGAVNITAGSSATNYTSVTWSGGSGGAFVNPNSLTICTYNPSAADITAGTVTLTLTATNNSCSNVYTATSTKTLTIYQAQSINLFSAVGTDNQSLCNNVAITPIVYTIGGSATGATQTGSLPSGVTFNSSTYTISGTPTASGTFNYTITTTGNGVCTGQAKTGTITVAPLLTWANLQAPGSGSICTSGTYTIYGQVYQAGITPGAGQGAGIAVQFGYSSASSNPISGSGWTWTNATYNSSVTGNNDEYQGTLSGLSAGTYYYAFRYSLNGCQYQYGGYSSGGGGFWDGVTYVSGILTVNSVPVISSSTSGLQTWCQGATPTNLTVATSAGTNLTYQWYSNTANSTSTGTITNLGSANGAQTVTCTPSTSTGGILYYFVIISNSGCSSVTSGVYGPVITNSTGTWLGLTNEWNSASNWCGGIPTSTTNVVISTGVTYFPKIDSANAVANSITINSGASLTMTGSYNLTISAGGNFTNNAGTTGLAASTSTGVITFLGGGSTVSGTTYFQNVTAAGTGGLDFGISSTIYGTFQISSGATFIANSHPPIYDCGSTLVYNSGGATTYNRGSEWLSVTSGAGYPGNVHIGSGTYLVYNYVNSTDYIGTDGNVCGNLTVDAGGALYMDYDYGTYSNAGSHKLVVNGNVTINGMFSLGYNVGGDLYVGGNFTLGPGTAVNGNGFPNNNGRAVFFNGASGGQFINKTGGGNVYFDFLIIDKPVYTDSVKIDPATNVVIRGTSTTNNQVLQLLGGNLDLSGGNITLDCQGLATSINVKVDGTGTRRIFSSVLGGSLNIVDSTFSQSGHAGQTSFTVSNANSTLLLFDNGVNVNTSVGVDFGSGITTINDTLQLNSWGFVIGDAPNYGNLSTLIYNNSGSFERNMEWNGNASSTGGFGYPNNVIVQNNTTVNMNQTYSTSINLGCSGYLNIKSGSTLDMNNMAHNLIVGTDVLIAGTLNLSTVANGDIQIGRNWTRTGTFTENSRNVTFNTDSNSVLTATGGQLFSNLYLSKNLATESLTLHDSVFISSEVGFTEGKLILGSKAMTIQSNNTNGTAHIAAITTPANVSFDYSGGGKFYIERYLPMSVNYYSRRWRLLTAPISNAGNPSLWSCWQEGATPTSVTSNATIDSSGYNPFPGNGTEITKTIVPTGNYDAGSTNNPSIYYMNPGSPATWAVPTATNGTTATSGLISPKGGIQGYMVFVRGDRSIVVSSPYINTTGGNTLREKGQINYGNDTVSLVIGNQIIGNPYASEISFNNVNFNGVTPGTSSATYYLWDPKLVGSQGVGGWVSFSSNSNGSYLFVPYDTTTTGMSNYANDGTFSDGNIESGAAFMVHSASLGNFIIHETDKSTNTTPIGIASRPSGQVSLPVFNFSTLYTNLFSNTGSSMVLADGVATAFGADYHDAVDEQDALKMQTFSTKEKIGLLRDSVLLSIERRNVIQASDTVFYYLALSANHNYQLKFMGINFDTTTLHGYIIDQYTGITTPVAATSYDVYNFSTDNTAQSYDVNRLKLVFRLSNSAPLAVKIVNVSAQPQNQQIVVDWNTQNEINIKNYSVERSTDGKVFSTVNTTAPHGSITGAASYNWIDLNPNYGINYYRIKAESLDGSVQYSKTVTAKIGNLASLVSIYPNPIMSNTIQLQMTNMATGSYQTRVINSIGQVIINEQMSHNINTLIEVIQLNKTVAAGVYNLEITGPDNTVSTIQFEKQ